jgi:hypothetical protein
MKGFLNDGNGKYRTRTLPQPALPLQAASPDRE